MGTSSSSSNIKEETSEKDGYGWTTWRDFRSCWSHSVFDLLSFSVCPDAIDCDALNTTVSASMSL
jgi:hypothetical protein